MDFHEQMTITMIISNNLIDTFLPHIAIGSGIRINNFSIKNKTQFERGDADCYIVLTIKSSIETPDLTISQLIEADRDYSVGSFGAIATSYHINKSQLEVHVKDGDLHEGGEDMAMVFVQNSNAEMCAILQQMFSTADMLLILLKNAM